MREDQGNLSRSEMKRIIYGLILQLGIENVEWDFVGIEEWIVEAWMEKYVEELTQKRTRSRQRPSDQNGQSLA